MAYEQKPGQGSLFKNQPKDDKPLSEKAPQYKGKLMTPDGKLYEIAAWVRQSANGTTYMSLSVQEPRTQEQPTIQSQTATATPSPQPAKPLMDDLPF